MVRLFLSFHPKSPGLSSVHAVLPLPSQAKFLTQDQINEFKECFSLYDCQRRGKIKAQELITVMRCLGSNPTPPEVQRHLLSHNIGQGGELDFSTFLSVMHRQLQQEAPEQEILQALKMADKEHKGFVLATELRATLTGLGEKLTNTEVDELLKEAGVGADGRVHCEQFAKAVTRSSAKR
ncbi:calmodulin-like protein 4 isoform X1 [Hippoglossus stenolepis]|uniref:calmodulin-like protein 4 isoform X1 n=1 Tax=Hippoglossus stenolepis TaxID=195615 RepID=UPI00159C581F|nr:calmodulin-like protein 4 isoform X1 [Hippoglossus stenolepis]